MKKRDLLRLIESENRKKRIMNEDFYYGDTNEDVGIMSRRNKRFSSEEPGIAPNWKEDEEDYEEYKTPPGKERPGIAPGREDDEAPRPRNKMSRLSRRMNDPAIIDPDIDTDPDIDPDVIPFTEPDEWEGPDRKEPNIRPDTNPNPMGRPKTPNIDSFKRDFDRIMTRMDESYHKPIKYKKY